MKLQQRRLWDQREFTLLDTTVRMHIISPTQDITTEIAYEKLGLRTLFIRKKEASLFITSIGLAAALTGSFMFRQVTLSSLVEVILLGVTVLFISMALFFVWFETRKPLLVITGGDQQISLLADAPTAQAVSEFVEALQSRIRQRLIYLRVRPHDKELSLSYKKQALEHLQEIGIIDTQMAVRILADMEEQHTTGDTPIGF